VCIIIYFNHIGAIALRGLFTESVRPFHIIDLNCTGGERAVLECPYNNLQSIYSCASRNDASVICQCNMYNIHIHACKINYYVILL
jgi:deleted-in-malignant-brain-tumors protein 1